MKSTCPGVRRMGISILACVMAFVIAVGLMAPDAAMAASDGQSVPGSARFVDDGSAGYGEQSMPGSTPYVDSSPMSFGEPSMPSQMSYMDDSTMYYGDPYGGDWYGGDPYGGDWYGGDPYGGDWYGGDWYGGQYYTVRFGDTLSKIAARFGTTTKALMRANGINNPNYVYVGQVLVIPGGSGGTGGKVCQNEHVVRRGETLSGIAYWYGIDTYTLMRANGISNANHIYAGQILCIPDSYGQLPTHPSQPVPVQPMPPSQPSKPSQPPGQPMPPSQPSQPSQPVPVQPMPPSKPSQPSQPSQPPVQPMPPSQPSQPSQPPTQPDPCLAPTPYQSGPQTKAIQPDPDPCQPMPPTVPCQQDCGPSQPGHGKQMDYWKGSYFKDKYFSEFVEERQDPEVRFNWRTGAPFEGMPEDRFSVRWERAIYVDGGKYRFHATADDGVRVSVDGQMVIDGWQIQPATEYTGDIDLSRGTHWVVVEYYEEAEDAQIDVYWEYAPKFMPYN